MNVALEDVYSGYCHWRSLAKCMKWAIASKEPRRMAAVAASGGEYDGGN